MNLAGFFFSSVENYKQGKDFCSINMPIFMWLQIPFLFALLLLLSLFCRLQHDEDSADLAHVIMFTEY
jgi:hypothetical protein